MSPLRDAFLAVAFVGVALTAAVVAEVVGHRVRPVRRDATEDRIRQLQVPAGITVGGLGRELGSDDANGVVYRVTYTHR
jgi:hypothetical protein